MKHEIFFLAFLIILLQLSCQRVKSPLSSQLQKNLVQNGSFEQNGQPSLQYWENVNEKIVEFSKDVPSDGGTWCVVLHPERTGPFHESFFQKISLQPGKYNLALSFYAKKNGNGNGYVQLYKKKPDGIHSILSVNVTDTTWTHYTQNITVHLATEDTLKILLSGGTTEVVDWKTYFDNVALTIKP